MNPSDTSPVEMNLRSIGSLSMLAVALACAWPRPAHACGGTFCDGGPTTMPVDQTGENILFTIEDGHVEAHIQIQYEGDADSFAWIVPVLAVPEVSVGSEPLFRSMLAATVPTFTLQGCGGGGDGGGGCGAFSRKEDDGQAAGDFDDDGTDVLGHGTAGAYEYVVLEGMTSTDILQWLTDHEYAADPEAAPILQQYVDEHFLFVAFRLRGGASVDEIHPVVLRWAGEEPCVPIRLTRVAAVEDMAIRVFFLGRDRFVPTNYRHVELNLLKLDWVNLGANYDEVLTLAIDGEAADGHAFVTEYAGPANVVDENAIRGVRWDASAFVEIEAIDVVEELQDQGLMTCSELRCDPLHPLIGPLLADFLPTPAGVPSEVFWATLEDSLDQASIDAFSGPELAAAMEERIVGPAEHALDMLRGADVLTRMVTTISPVEMTADPLFHAVDDLPDVSNILTAAYEPDCANPERIALPDGREVRLEDGAMPLFADMAYAEAVQTIPPNGAPMVLVDHRDDHADQLEAWNDDGGCSCRVGRFRLDALLFAALVLLGVRARRRA